MLALYGIQSLTATQQFCGSGLNRITLSLVKIWELQVSLKKYR